MQENFNPQNEKLAQKQAEWEKMKGGVDKVTDGLGKGVEEGIKEVVVVLNLLDFPTSGSCEGHTKEEGRGRGYPWVEFDSEKNKKYKTEHDFIWKVRKELRKYKKEQIDPEYDGGKWPKEAWEKYYNFEKSLSEYAEYMECLTKIANANQELHIKLHSMLEEYYLQENANTTVKYVIRSFDRTHVMHLRPENDPKFEDAKEHDDFLEKSRAEMQRLTEFLKKKYFSE